MGIIGAPHNMLLMVESVGAVGVLASIGVTTMVGESLIPTVVHAREQDVKLHSTIRGVSVCVDSLMHLEVLKC